MVFPVTSISRVPLGTLQRAGRPHRDDAVVADENVRTFDDFVALHRDRARVAQHDLAARLVLPDGDRDVDACRLVGRAAARGVARCRGAIAPCARPAARGIRTNGRVAHERVRTREIVREVAVSNGEVRAVAVRLPPDEVTTDARQAPNGDRGLRGVRDRHRRRLPADDRDVHHVDVVIHLGQHAVTVRRDEDLAGVLGLWRGLSVVEGAGDPDVCLSVGPVEAHRYEAGVALRYIDPIVVGAREMRESGVPRHRRDGGCDATGGRQPDQLASVLEPFLDARLLR